MQIFNGNEHAKILEEKITEFVKNNPVSKKLAIVQIGDDSSSEKYVQLKKKFCEKVGVPIETHKIDSLLSDDEIFQQVENIFNNEDVLGGIIQLPLPRKSLYKALSLIPTNKDIDVISDEGKNKFYSGDFKRLSPVIRSINYFLDTYNLHIENMKVTIIGEGDLVGAPAKYYLSANKAKVSVLSNYTSECKIDCQLLILSAGVPNLVKGQNVNDGANVIDFGSSVLDGKYIGDLDMNSEINHLNFVSPSPGGVGPLVVRFLIMNFLGI